MPTQRIYYDDAFARHFSAQVIACEPPPPGTDPAWSVLLDRTAFYPSSGGQPHDLGLLGEAQILDVRDDGDTITHLVDRPVPLGPMQASIDWPRRFDHMQQHTGQHLLSAVLHQRFALPTISFHLGTDISTIDLRGPAPTDEILENAERAANQIIFEDRPVTIRYGTAEELAQLGIRKEVDRAGILRAIEIDSIDLQPCGGTHVQRTGQIGTLLIRRSTRVRQDWRVEFACGERAARLARKDYLALRRAGEILSAAPADVASTAERTLAERDAHFKTARAALLRLAESDAALAMQSTPPTPGGLRVFARIFREDTPPEYLGHLATNLAKFEKTVALLARCPCGHLILAQHSSAAKDMNALLKQVLSRYPGKGGGTRDFARGRLENAAQAEAALSFARDLVSAG